MPSPHVLSEPPPHRPDGTSPLHPRLSPRPSPPLSRATVIATLRAAGCVFAEDEAELLISTAHTADALAAMVERRVRGLPLEHVVGWAEFHGLRVTVDPGVFVPRRRTEFLVGQAIGLGRRTAARTGRPTVVVDLCCGSGAVGAALAAALDRVELYAADIEPAAVRCARRNVTTAGGEVYEGDLFEALPAGLRGRIDVLVANVPYVPTQEVGLLPPEAREHEPRVALDGGADGLDVLRRVTAAAPQWLAPGGHLLVETSERQAPQAVEAFTRNGLLPRVTASDELYATVIIGTAPPPHRTRQPPAPHPTP
ncbi:putative protein N(5)-glutamine methyltransferase [Streptomyces sioyaensis]|uniref:peptide chain release factor N(5)-glutamine methyltransferase n=1 Tax=Streptomyces sioyaensis TaxID=67364 RepID=A0A4Q1R1J7_9ACTN|nr:putative protein N(5)-glutamine methyltransferase [Streptomyces sioyaensis]MBM4794217.1 putative protein N(5)-glutamine methyltransferase [Streptomyces sioyaensis]RXS68616.1 putative protein N(5)-glutamine methyltransferase [Streptomyces sioyaensis]